MIEEACIQMAATSPEEATSLANMAFESFIATIAGKPVAIQHLRHSHWQEQDLIPESTSELYYALIRMRVSGEPTALEQLKHQLQGSTR